MGLFFGYLSGQRSRHSSRHFINNMTTISVVISAWNEEAKIKRCLSSVSWADEIIFVDNSSTDNTLRIAKQFTSKVFKRQNNPMLNVNKNFGFSQATSDWILSLDADEEVTKELAQEIHSVVGENNRLAGYWIPRKNISFGKWIAHGLWWPDKQLRLFRRNRGKFPGIHVHEYLAVDGPTGELQEPYIHYNYETISQFLRKMDTIYTESEVQKLMSTHYQLSWYDAIRFPISDFVKIYFAQQGYKDGLHGLVLSILQSFYSFIVFAKLWEKNKFNQIDFPIASVAKELTRAEKEIEYWIISSEEHESSSWITRLLLKIKRRVFTAK